MNGLALCAGVGGLELGLRLALGPTYRTICYVEREAYCAEVLAARMAEGHLDLAPIWDDVTTFSGRDFCGTVDIVSSGLPCQPYSLAGKQSGHADVRAIWPHLIRIVRECEPGAVFIENVPPFLKHFEPVWREIRKLGFGFAPPSIYSAQECGAPHIRRRLFILAAHPDRTAMWDESWRRCGAGGPGQAGPGDIDGNHPDPNSGRGCWLLDRQRETLGPNPYGRGLWSGNGRTPWQAESPIFRVANGSTYRVDELRAIGNGVVPAVAARAFRELTTALPNINDSFTVIDTGK